MSSGPTHMLGFWDKPEETAAAAARRLGLLRRPRPRPRGRLPADHRPQQGAVQERRRAGHAEGDRGAARPGHPGVSQVYAVGVPDDRWGEIGCAWVVPETRRRDRRRGPARVCREKLARFKVPKHVLVTTAEELPTTPTGKVQKFKLARRAAEQLSRPTAADRSPGGRRVHVPAGADGPSVGRRQPRLCWATKLSTISRLTGAVLSMRAMNHRSARPYSRDIPLPPWVWMAWSSVRSEESAAANFAMLRGLAGLQRRRRRARPPGRPSAAASWVPM